MREDLDDIRNKIKLVHTEIEAHKALRESMHDIKDSEADCKDQFVEVMEAFLEEANTVYSRLGKQYGEMFLCYEETVQLYGEEPAQTTPEEFLALFTTFMDSFTVSIRFVARPC